MMNDIYLQKCVLMWIAIFAFIATGVGSYAQQPAADAEVTFHVAWYDVGKATLDGLQGVHEVEKGWQSFKETNTVVYDPELISVEQMIEALKKARTFRGVAK